MRAVVALCASVLAGCDLPCRDDLDVDCAPLYEPTFDEVFAETLQPTCGQEGGSCHSAEGAKRGLVFADPDEAYALLTEGDRPLVVGGALDCSQLVLRIEATGSLGMPPGEPLGEAERCAIRQWVAAGALR